MDNKYHNGLSSATRGKERQMFYDSIQFKAMEGSLNALSMKQEVVLTNIANVDTPDYKVKDFNFSNVLEDLCRNDSEDGKSEYRFVGSVTERDETSTLLDGNNVDMEEQSLELYSTYLQSSAIIQKMNSTIADFRYVLTQSSFK